MAKIGWIGLGVMGYPMAGHLVQRGGHEVSVYNRSRAKAAGWLSDYGQGCAVPTPAAAASDADFVFCCVGNDDDLMSVTVGKDGAFSSMKHGAIFVDHTTASAKVARELAAIASKHGLSFLDCPVSGGQAGAQSGTLTVMCGGDAGAYAHAAPVMESYAKTLRLVGNSGAGQLTKMVNQIAVAGVIQGLAEAIHFAEQAGLDVDTAMETIAKGAAQSWQMDNRWKSMHARSFDFGFAVDWIKKDLGIVLDEARRNGSDLPVTGLLETYYAEVQARGGNRWDSSSLITRLGGKIERKTDS
jgi:3-hydroxyisobutyrate dehydrogenase